MNTMLFVSKTNPSASYHSVAEALASIPYDNTDPVTVKLDAGVYREKLEIAAPYVTLEGAGPKETSIVYDDYAYYIMPDGIKRGTFRSYTLFVNAAHVTLRDLTVENASGPSTECGQAIALYADGDYFRCENCHLIGKQDTLFTGPLPEKEYEPGGFRGPKEHAPRIPTRQYYKSCYICGDVDFIFGSATAYFDHCQLHSLLRDADTAIQGYITAASTPQQQEYGYIFSHCNLTSDCPPCSVYLGRPWRDYARTVFLHCTLGRHIHPEGFHDWGKEHARETVWYALYECRMADNGGTHTGIDSQLAPFVRILSADEAAHYEFAQVFPEWLQ